jgi:intracellular multiplication protein IcmL
MPEQNALLLIFSRNQHYQRLYFLTFGVFVLSILSVICLIGLLVMIKRYPGQPLYFATDNISRLIQVVPIAQPNLTEAEVSEWAEQAVRAVYSYDYVNYRSQFQRAQQYFTNYGWTKYMNALIASNNVLALTQRKMVVMADVVSEPTLLTEGLLGGAYAWKFSMPILVTYWLPPYNDQNKFTNPLTVTVLVQRQSPLKGDHGLGIVQLVGTLSTQDNDTQPQALSNTPS